MCRARWRPCPSLVRSRALDDRGRGKDVDVIAVRNADPPTTKEGRNGTEAGVEAKGKELSTKRVTLTSATTRDDNCRR